jgi:DNA-binding CsgD family transcriptional regulator
MILEGEAGIGKTALVRKARRIAANRGMRVLHARGSELEDELAFGVTRELYGSVDRELTFSGAAALAEPVLRVTSADDTTGDLFAVLHGLYWLTADLAATSPVLVAVDDAHWCDEPTLRHLAYLARRLDGLPAAVLLATRPAVDPVRGRLLDAVAAEPSTAVHRLAPLPETVVHEVVTSVLGETAEPAFSAACHVATGGNPFLLSELLSEAANAGITAGARDINRLKALTPLGVQRSVQNRLARLPAAATALARAAAVLGDGTSLHRAARLAGITDADAVPLADALVAARILEPRVPPSFAHPLVRSAVAAGLGPGATAAWHRRAAELIAAEGGGGDELVPHLLAAPPCADEWVVATLSEAAHRAAARGAPDIAARYLARALEEPPAPDTRVELLYQLGVAQARACLPEAPRMLTEALSLTADPVGRARIALVLLRTLLPTGRFVDAVAVGERVLDELGDAEHDLRLQLEADLLVAGVQDPRLWPSASRRVRSRGPDPTPAGPAECRMLAALAIEEVLRAGSRDRAVDLAEQALVGGHLVAGDAIAILPCAVSALTMSGRVRRSLQVWDDLAPLLRRRGDVWAATLASSFGGYAAYHAGDLHRAIGDTRFAVEMARTVGDLSIETYTAAWLAYALVDAGDHTQADEELTRAAVLVGPAPTLATNYVLSARGLLRLAQGRAEDAVADLRECGRRMDEWATVAPAVCPWRPALALALYATGDQAEAAAVAEEALAVARGWPTPHVLVDALRAAGLVTGGERGLAMLEEAVAVSAAGESPLEHAQALTALGGAIRRTGRLRSARDPLRVAVDLAERCGATAVARRARDELVATGARPRRLRSTGANALTATQQRVAAMAAEGLASREIAQALFVSEKTVETHLTQAYRKLGISARSQLADALGCPASGPVLAPGGVVG